MEQNQMTDQHYTSNIGQAGSTGKKELTDEEVKEIAKERADKLLHNYACGKDRSAKAKINFNACFDDDDFENALCDCIYMFEHPTKSDYCHKVALQKLVLSVRDAAAKYLEIDVRNGVE